MKANLATLATAAIVSGLSVTALGGAAYVAQVQAERDALAAQVRALGEEPVAQAQPEQPQPMTSEEVRRIAEAVRAAEPQVTKAEVIDLIGEAVANSLPAAEPGQQGDPGPQGQPGTDGSDGRDGSDGTDGTNGEQGPAGTPGSSPSEAEIRAVVEAVYAADPPADGEQGPQGDPGVSVVAVQVLEGQLVIDLSDGTSIDAGTVPGATGEPFCPVGYDERVLSGHFWDEPGGKADVLSCVQT